MQNRTGPRFPDACHIKRRKQLETKHCAYHRRSRDIRFIPSHTEAVVWAGGLPENAVLWQCCNWGQDLSNRFRELAVDCLKVLIKSTASAFIRLGKRCPAFYHRYHSHERATLFPPHWQLCLSASQIHHLLHP